MSVMTTAPTYTNLGIVQKVRAGCRVPEGNVGRCVRWIFDRLEELTAEQPKAQFRDVWYAMKRGRAWKTAGFCLEDWQRASSHVSTAFDRAFQAPIKHRSKGRSGPHIRRGGRRCPDKGRRLAA